MRGEISLAPSILKVCAYEYANTSSRAFLGSFGCPMLAIVTTVSTSSQDQWPTMQKLAFWLTD